MSAAERIVRIKRGSGHKGLTRREARGPPARGNGKLREEPQGQGRRVPLTGGQAAAQRPAGRFVDPSARAI